MKLTITLNGKEKTVNIPYSYDHLTFRQFLEIAKLSNDNEIISYLTDVPLDILRKAKIINLEQVLHLLSFLKKEPVPRVPERLGLYILPKDLGFETIAQLEDMKSAIKEIQDLDKVEQLAKYIYYCAIYAAPQLSRERCDELAARYPNEGIQYGDYHYRKSELIQDEFLNCPAPEVLGVGHFTLLRLTGLNLGIDPNYRIPLTRMKRLRLVLKRLGMRLASWEYLTTWAKRHVLRKQSY
jgi:hypothetical protein